MSAEKAQGLVIRMVDFGETSCVVTLFTREFGRITALAKGAFRPKGPFEAALDLLNECRLVFLRKSPSALDLLTETKLERRFRPPPKRLSHLHAAYYLAELLQELTVDDDPQSQLYDAAVQTLNMLAHPNHAGRCVLWFETAMLRALGRMPDLESCVECDEPLPTQGRVLFGRVDSGPLCVRCRSGKRSVVSVGENAYALWKKLANGECKPDASWHAESVAPATVGELRGFMSQLICDVLGKRPRVQHLLPSEQETKAMPENGSSKVTEAILSMNDNRNV